MLVASPTFSPLSTREVLQAVFPAGNSGPSRARTCALHIIPQGVEPRWILFGSPHKAAPVLRSWRPFNLSTRLRWSVVTATASADLLAHLPGVLNETAIFDLDYWRQSVPGFEEDWTPVVHIGNPSHTRKAIAFFVGADRQIKAVAKVPLVADAGSAILNEAQMLGCLGRTDCFPHTLFSDAARGIAAQSWLEGKPISRDLTAAHMDLLARLAQPESTACVADHRTAIARDLDRLDLPYDRTVLARALELLDFHTELPAFIEHRDFAPWNLKRLADGRLGLLDWEWAVPDSLPCQDIVRFFYIQDALFNGPGDVLKTITSHPLLKAHYQRFEIPTQALLPLTMHYLLRVLAMDWLSGNRRLTDYTFRQIGNLLQNANSK